MEIDRWSTEFDVAVLGLGYVGLSLALRAADVGLRVLGIERDRERLATLRRGCSYVDDVSDEEVRAHLGCGLSVAPTLLPRDSAGAYILCAPTPLEDGVPDLAALRSMTEAVGQVIRPGQLVSIESTVAPGTTEEVVVPILEARSGLAAGQDFAVVTSPERVDPGNPSWSIENTPKLVGGTTPECTKRGSELYNLLCDDVVILSGTREAEMAKLIENAQRLIGISFVNELIKVGPALGVDVWEALRGAATKPFGYASFRPGPGVGGHCIPIDPVYLVSALEEAGERSELISAALSVNQSMPDHVFERIVRVLGSVGLSASHSSVHVAGISYKEDVADLRASPAVEVVHRLIASGACVSYSDPMVRSGELEALGAQYTPDLEEGLQRCDLAVLMVAHSAFDLDALALSDALVLDTRGLVPGASTMRI